MKRISAVGFWSGCSAVVLLLIAVPLVLESKTASAQEKAAGEQAAKEKPAFGFKAWGKLGSPLKDAPGFYYLTYYQKGARGRLKSVQAFLKLKEDLTPLMDRRVTDKDLKEGEELFILGKPLSRSVQSPFGGTLKQLNITDCQAVLSGKDVEVNLKYKNPRDSAIKWCRTKYLGDLKVNYEKESYKLRLGRTCPILKRQEGTSKLLRRGAYIFVAGNKIDERPETKKKSDAKKECFEAEKVVVLDRGLIKKVYPAVFE